MNGRRARQLRRYAETLCALAEVTDHGPHAYQPQTVRSARVILHRPEVRLMRGPRATARKMRRAYARGHDLDAAMAVGVRRG